MGFFSKLGAVVVGVGSAAGWVASQAASAALDSMGDKIGKGSVSDSRGNSYTGRDYHNKARDLESKSGFFEGGFSKAKELWNKD